jgi:hypothetical protein
MYGFPGNLEYSRIIGHSATQICVGQFDLQFTLGDFRFIAQSPVTLLKNGISIGAWDGVSWPDSAFYDMMNVAVTGIELPDTRTMHISFENGITIVLHDNSDMYETLHIVVGEAPSGLYIV